MKYYAKIDGLRGIAISLILIEHFAFAIGKHITAGYYGVDLFFVISGFLITSILLKPNDRTFGSNYKNFIGRRTLRIFPIYYLTIIILWLLNLDIVREKMIWLLTYTYNFAAIKFNLPGTPISHLWSLCVEEQFYLCWPFIVISLKKELKTLTAIILVVIGVGYAQLFFNAFTSINPYIADGLLARIPSLGLGALGAVLMTRGLLPERVFKSRGLEILTLCVLVISLVLPYRFRLFPLGICSFYLVLKAANYEFSLAAVERFLKSKYVVRMGIMSYGIYVYHQPLAYYFTKYVFDPMWNRIPFGSMGRLSVIEWNSWILKLPVFSVLSVGVAWLSFNFIEKPILSLKDRFFSLGPTPSKKMEKKRLMVKDL